MGEGESGLLRAFSSRERPCLIYLELTVCVLPPLSLSWGRGGWGVRGLLLKGVSAALPGGDRPPWSADIFPLGKVPGVRLGVLVLAFLGAGIQQGEGCWEPLCVAHGGPACPGCCSRATRVLTRSCVALGATKPVSLLKEGHFSYWSFRRGRTLPHTLVCEVGEGWGISLSFLGGENWAEHCRWLAPSPRVLGSLQN